MAITADSNWREQATCASLDPNLPFGSDRDDEEPYGDKDARRFAREVCPDCPVRWECLNYAYANKIPYGVFGGKTAAQRGWQRGAD